MPSNKDLTTEAEKLAKELGIEVQTEGLNNEKLGDLVSDLKAKKKDAEHKTQADKAPVKKPEAKKKPPFTVAKGKAITSRAGILAEGDEIKASYLAASEKESDQAAGQKALESFVESGHVDAN